MDMEAFTPTERRMVETLLDGRAHPPADLLACLPEWPGVKVNIAPHLGAIRKKLRASGHGVLCDQVGGAVNYRLVRLLAPADD